MGERPGIYHNNGFAEEYFIPECKEISDEDAKYLAGVFEIGGGISIRPETKKDRPNYINVRPKAYFNDSNEKTILKMAERFGGMAFPLKTEQSWRWLAQGKNALHILEQSKPYMPFRSPQVDLMETVCNGAPLNTKLAIAEKFSEYINGYKEYPDPSAYTYLLSDPYFLKGLYDGRGATYTWRRDDFLRFNSQNMGLMVALADSFGEEATPSINTRWQRVEDSFVPVTFNVQLYGQSRDCFLDTIAPAS